MSWRTLGRWPLPAVVTGAPPGVPPNAARPRPAAAGTPVSGTRRAGARGTTWQEAAA